MRMFRLADLFEHKYNGSSVVKTAASPAEVFKQAKDDILTNYKNWVMNQKYRALKILAEAGEPNARALYDLYNDLVANIDSLNHIQVFHKVNKILDLIRQMKSSGDYRQSIHDMVPVEREADRNYREQLKGGFETNLSRISYGLEKVAKALQKYVAASMLHGGAVEPQRKALSKEKLRMFMMTPVAQHYKLDDIDVMQRILAFPETREKITTLINAIDRGHIPADGPEVMAEAQTIRKLLDAQEKTNLSALEQMPEKPAPAVSLFEEEEEKPE